LRAIKRNSEDANISASNPVLLDKSFSRQLLKDTSNNLTQISGHADALEEEIKIDGRFKKSF
jgi:hypothetical protein